CHLLTNYALSDHSQPYGYASELQLSWQSRSSPSKTQTHDLVIVTWEH
ncbi:11825_t:CDS:2, partial [Ambispora leptoticha]